MIEFEFNTHSFELKRSDGGVRNIKTSDERVLRRAILLSVREWLVDEADRLVRQRENTYSYSGFDNPEMCKREAWISNTREKIRECLRRMDDNGAFLRHFGYVMENIRLFLYPKPHSRNFKNFDRSCKDMDVAADFYLKGAFSLSDMCKIRRNPPVVQTSIFD